MPMLRSRMPKGPLAPKSAALIAAIMALATPTHGHQAPSGWEYPRGCCDGTDCYPIPSEAVAARPDGSYIIKATGEVFLHPDARGAPGARHFRWSGDAMFHRCSPKGLETDERSFCLFVPQPGV